MALIDNFKSWLYRLPLFAPAYHQKAITPHDTNELPVLPRAIRFDGGGTVVLTAPDETDADVDQSYTVVAGERLDIRAKKIKSTGTTATGIVIWW